MQVTIEKLDHFGRGICHIDDKITFVKDSLPDEIVDISIYKETKKYNLAKVNKHLKTSTNRVNPPCKYYNICGGCHIMHMNYKTQLSFKENKVKEILKRYANIDNNIIKDIEFDDQFNYRNKLTLHNKDNKLGLYKENSNDIVEIEKCLLVNDNINKKLSGLKKETIIDNKKIVIKGTNKIITSLDKDDYLIEEISNKKFIVSKDSFYQVNYKLVSRLYDKAISYLKDKNYKKVLDLYCGTGTIGILASDYVKEVIGIEINKSSYQDALKNKELNNITNIEFINGKVEDHIDEFIDIDAVIVDPPRSGLDKYTIENIIKIRPQIVIYVSCDPITLARDIKLLDLKYEAKEITPFDMFPNTHHCESVCILERR